MKFSCDSCGATYMISDEKVGPNGVRVRCKKCGNQITVRRAFEAPVLERTAPAMAPAPAAGPGLEDELGSAFDQAFGDKPVASAPAPAGPVPEAPVAAASSPAPQEWYVAIGEAQVGPLPLAEVKKRWEAGDIGPDSLVWRPGMTEWGPLSGVPELAAYLAPVPQPSAPSTAPAAAVFAGPGGRPASPQARPAAPAPDVEWKPTGASALAALASEEMASRAPSPVSAPAAPRSVMEQLPDSGGVDPTGAIPLPIKAMERTDERPVRRSSVARGAQELRHKRTMRTVVVVAVLAVVAVAGGAFAWIQLSARTTPPVPVAVQPVPPPADVTPAPPPPAPLPTAASNVVAEAPAAVAVPPSPPPAPPAPEPAKAAAAPAPKKDKAPAPARPARPAVAQAAPAAKPAAEKPAARKKDGLLDFDQGGEDDLAAALGSGTSGRKVYVPPAVGGAAAAPDRLSDAQIMESVKLHSDGLQRCVSEQRAREPGARGTIKVAWVVALDGVPRDVRCITPEFAQGEFARCLVGVVRTIRFPRIADPKGQNITFPFQF
jgi:predicted Zn finger-like uncharacterized protein